MDIIELFLGLARLEVFLISAAEPPSCRTLLASGGPARTEKISLLISSYLISDSINGAFGCTEYKYTDCDANWFGLGSSDYLQHVRHR